MKKGEWNIVCPENAKSFLVRFGAFEHPHFFSKEEVFSLAFLSYEDEDVLKLAQLRNLSFNHSKQVMKSASLLKDWDEEKAPTTSLEKLWHHRRVAIEAGLLRKADPLSVHAFRCRPVALFGCSRSDRTLLEALGKLNVNPTWMGLDEFLDGKETTIVHSYPEAWVEILFGLSWLCGEIERLHRKGPFLLSDVQIVCPRGYLNSLQGIATMFRLPLSFPIDSMNNLPEVKDLMGEFQKAGLEGIEGKIDSLFHDSARKKLIRAYRTLSTLSSLRPALQSEYLTSSLEDPYAFSPAYESIHVATDLKSAKPSSACLVLGFSDALVPSKKDNGLIGDRHKGEFSYLSTAVEENEVAEEEVKTALSLSSSLRVSCAENDGFLEYPPVAFHKREWLSYQRGEEDYVSRASEKGGAREDLAFYHAVFHDRYDAIRLEDPMAMAIAKTSPPSARAYASYDNDFDDDEETQDYFRRMFEGTIKLSHSSIDAYQANPFNYYCSKVLKLSTSTNFKAIAGSLIHLHAEQRGSFDFDRSVEKLLEGLPDPIEGMHREQLLYFLKNADRNFVEFDLPTFEAVERFCGLSQVRPSSGKEEFQASLPMPLDSVLTVYYDQVYQREGGYLLVDYKTAKKADYYVGILEALLGRKLQLPLYSFAFDEVRKRFPEIEGEGKLFGSFICCLPYAVEGILSPHRLFAGFQYAKGEGEKGELCSSKEAREVFGKGNPPILALNSLTPPSSSEEKEKGDDLSKAFALQDAATASLSFGEKIDALFPGGSPSTEGLPPPERILSSALTTYLFVVQSLRRGRIRTGKGVRWFPVYPAYLYHRGKLSSIGFGDYEDVAFPRPYQKHLLSLDEKPKARASYDDFDSLSQEAMKAGDCEGQEEGEEEEGESGDGDFE